MKKSKKFEINHKFGTKIFKDRKMIQNNKFNTLIICYFVLFSVFIMSSYQKIN